MAQNANIIQVNELITEHEQINLCILTNYLIWGKKTSTLEQTVDNNVHFNP